MRHSDIISRHTYVRIFAELVGSDEVCGEMYPHSFSLCLNNQFTHYLRAIFIVQRGTNLVCVCVCVCGGGGGGGGGGYVQVW